MSSRNAPNRTITKGVPRGITAVCGYFSRNPYRPCTEAAEYLVVTHVQRGLQAYELKRVVCGAHVPQDKTPAPVKPSGFISTKEAADVIGVNEYTIHQWRGRGKGPQPIKVSGRYWYRPSEIEQFAEAYRMVHERSGS